MSNNNMYDGVLKAIEKNQKQELASGEITSVGTDALSIRLDGAKSSMSVPKPANFYGARGDTCSLARNPRTLQWEVVEVKGNTAPSPTGIYTGAWTNPLVTGTNQGMYIPIPYGMGFKDVRIDMEMWGAQAALENMLIGVDNINNRVAAAGYANAWLVNGVAATWITVTSGFNPAAAASPVTLTKFSIEFIDFENSYTNNLWVYGRYQYWYHVAPQTGLCSISPTNAADPLYLYIVRSAFAAINGVKSRYRYIGYY